MAILFHDDVKKGINSREEALRILRSFLDEKEPQFVYFLHHIWNTQQKAITYKELREAIMKGYLTPEIIEEWQQDYSKFVVKHVKPMYAAAMAAAASQIARKYPAFSFNTAAEGVKIWTDNRAAEFVTNSTAEQVHAIRFAVARASQLQDVSVDGLARSIRAMVGLNKPQTMANLNYYQKMIESGVPQQKAIEQSIKYSARQSRYRGQMIARTELAFSYNKGEQFSVEQAVEEGYMGEMEKVWCTADDERTCDTCGKLEGKRIGLHDHFGFQTKLKQRDFDIDLTPPAHPQCRCTVLYVEAKPPNFTHL